LGRPVLGLLDPALANCARRGDPNPTPPSSLRSFVEPRSPGDKVTSSPSDVGLILYREVSQIGAHGRRW